MRVVHLSGVVRKQATWVHGAGAAGAGAGGAGAGVGAGGAGAGRYRCVSGTGVLQESSIG